MRVLIFFAFICCVFFAKSQTLKFAPLVVSVMDHNKQPIVYDKIFFQGRKTKIIVTGITDVRGIFTTRLPVGDVYDIRIDAIGDQLEYNSVEIPAIPDNAEYGVMELFVMYEMPEMFTLSNLHFETGKSMIKTASYASLDQLAEFLIRKKRQNVLIAGHTDNVGDSAENNMLSLNRAEAVKKYLINKGVPPELIKAKGFGATQPIDDNSSKAGRAMNRRTEIHIVK
jgi:outer membrane protein OmpA-like peptidoglycan-associated protein